MGQQHPKDGNKVKQGNSTKTNKPDNTADPTASTGSNNNNINNNENVPPDSIDYEQKQKEAAYNYVLQKIMNNEVYAERLTKPGEEATLKKFAMALSDIEQMKKTYLSTDWVQTVELFRELKEREGDDNGSSGNNLKKTKSKMQTNISVPESGVSLQPIASQADEYDEDDNVDVTEEELAEYEMSEDAVELFKSKIRIKLVIAEVATSRHKKNIRKLICPILSKLDLLPEFGLFHSALMIGPWLIEWNNSALCVPRKCVSKAAILSVDVMQLSTKDEVHDVVGKLADVIVKWNTTKGYKDRGGDKEKYGNCQDFVDDILSTLNIQMKFKGPLADYVRTLREEGKADIVFNIDNNFRQAFSMKERSIQFKTHLQLDEFVDKLLAADPDFERNYPEEWAILKSFDRAFWMRWFKFPKDEKFRPLHKKVLEDDAEFDDMKCPFGDPRISGSIRGV